MNVGAKQAASSFGRRASAEDAEEAGGKALPPPWASSCLRRHRISVTGTGAWAPSCSLDGTSQPTWDKHTLCSCVFVSPPLLGRWGQTYLQQNYLQKGASTPETLPCKPAACSPASGVTWADSTMSAVHSDSLILSRCQESPRHLRVPWAASRHGWQPFLSGRPRSTPAAGEGAHGGDWKALII